MPTPAENSAERPSLRVPILAIDDVLELPFDQYQRYKLVVDLIESVRGERPPRILDVGGRTAVLRAFLPDDNVELVDLEPSEAAGLVLGSGSRLPFGDGSVDIVCAFDTLEHVPEALRADFVRECARVARTHVILAGPYRDPAVDTAEERLRDFLRGKLGVEHRYLNEHRSNGLPDRARVEELLREAGARVESIGHGHLGRWLAGMCAEMYMDHDPLLRPLARPFFRFYNQTLYAADVAPPVYRHAVVATFGEAPAPRLAIDADERPTESEVEALAEFGRKLAEYDVQRTALEPELERLRGIIGDLEDDLEGHKSRLKDTQEDLAEHVASLNEAREIHAKAEVEHAADRAVLEADLAEHQRSLAEAEEILAKERAEQAQIQAALEADLAEHKGTIADLERDKAAVAAELEEAQRQAAAQEAALRAEIARHEQVKGELETALAETQAGAEQIQTELRRALGDIDFLNGKLAERQAALRDRIGNLKRAFGPKPTFD